MTDNEYEQVKQRLLADGLIQESVISAQQQKSRKYFSEAYNYMRQRYLNDIMPAKACWPAWGVAWDHVRRLTIWSFGISSQCALREEWQEEANSRAKKFIDILVDSSLNTNNWNV